MKIRSAFFRSNMAAHRLKDPAEKHRIYAVADFYCPATLVQNDIRIIALNCASRYADFRKLHRGWQAWLIRLHGIDLMIPDLLLPVKVGLLIDMILLTPLRDSQTTGFAFPDSFPPDIDHGFVFGHDQINIAHLVQPPLTESMEVFGSPVTSMVIVRVSDPRLSAYTSRS